MPDLTPQLTQLPVGLCFSAHTSPAAKPYARVPAQGNDFKPAEWKETRLLLGLFYLKQKEQPSMSGAGWGLVGLYPVRQYGRGTGWQREVSGEGKEVQSYHNLLPQSSVSIH